MKKRLLITLTVILLACIVSCDGTVDKLLFEGREYNITYTPGSGSGTTYSTKTIKGYHEVLPNSELELTLSQTKGIGDNPKDGYTGYLKRDFSFYGWTDQDGVYYIYNPNNKKIKFSKDVTLEALWRNDLTGEIITNSQYAAITNYTGENAETLIIPRVITIWDDPEYPNGKECLVTRIESGAVTDDTLKNVILPDTITEIKENAFSNCDNLESIEIKSETPPSIEDKALPGNTKIQVPEEKEETYKQQLTSFTDRIEKKQEQQVVVNHPVTKVQLSPKQLSLIVGNTRRLTYSVTPGNATNQGVSFDSDNKSVATVEMDGTVTAVSAGTATITVTTEDGNKQDTCTVTVETAYTSATGVILNKKEMTLTVGNDETLIATVNPENATNKDVTWKSSDTDIAKVDANGKVTGIKAGKTSVTVTTKDGSYTTSCDVTVNAIRVTGVTLDKKTTSIDIGSSETLTYTVNPTDADDKTVTWSSSLPSIATVDTTGKVTGVSSGIAIITVKTNDGQFTDTCTVTINNSSAGFDVSSQYPTITGTLSQQTSGTDITVTLTSQDSITSYVWFVDNRLQTGETSSSITLSSSPWKRTVKCLFSTSTASGQATLDIAGTQFN